MSATAFQRMRREKALNEQKEAVSDTQKELKDMSVEELTAYAKKKEINIGQATTQAGILKKIQEAEKTE